MLGTAVDGREIHIEDYRGRVVLNDMLRAGLLQTEKNVDVAERKPLKTFRGSGLQAGVDLNDSRSLQ